MLALHLVDFVVKLGNSLGGETVARENCFGYHSDHLLAEGTHEREFPVEKSELLVEF
jgi:hypothetical protein